MHLILGVLLVLLLGAMAVNVWRTGRLLPPSPGTWGSSNDDPRVAVAGMLYAVAVEDGPLTGVEEQMILSQLTGIVGTDGDTARRSFASGRRLANRLSGDLNSRLHQMRVPIERKCSPKEKQDVIDMLHAVAGNSAENVLSVREGLGRLSATLLHG